jgi:hypothetical protein
VHTIEVHKHISCPLRALDWVAGRGVPALVPKAPPCPFRGSCWRHILLIVIILFLLLLLLLLLLLCRLVLCATI